MITIVGEAPSKSSDPKRPFDGWSGRKIAEYCGLDGYEELAARARLVNVLSRWPGPGYAGEKGSKFPIDKARFAARKLRFKPGVILFAGKRVAAAFGWEAMSYFTWAPIGAPFVKWKLNDPVSMAVVIPHPSGANRFWNYESNRSKARRFLERVFFRQDHVVSIHAFRSVEGPLPC